MRRSRLLFLGAALLIGPVMLASAANRRILLIDDMPSIHEVFRRRLSGTDTS